jgi:murein L,D-transpeptidase YafK
MQLPPMMNDHYKFFENVHVPLYRAEELQRQRYYMKENVNIKSDSSTFPIDSPSKPWKNMLDCSDDDFIGTDINDFFGVCNGAATSSAS